MTGVSPRSSRWAPRCRRRPRSGSTTTRCCCRAWSTRTCTSTIPAAASGRASTPPPARPRPAASRRSSTCRSTACRRPSTRTRCRSSARRRPAGSTSMSASGVARCPATWPRCPRCTRPGCSASSASCSTPASRSSPPLTHFELADALRVLRDLDALMIVHAEDAEVIDAAPPSCGRRYRDFLASRPRRAENEAIKAVIALARRTGARVHILHLSSADALPLIADAKAEGLRITAETCPHYLCFTAEDIPDGATQFKCCPPIREDANRDALWRGLADGVIDFVVSDHSPCTEDLKRLDTGDFGHAWGGVASLQLGLPAVWTEARRRGFDLSQVVSWMATKPALLAGFARKGRIAVGADADLSMFAPDQPFTVDVHKLAHRNPVTPYHGRDLTGVVRATWLRGRSIAGDQPFGQLLTRGDS
ncbi:allantoinase [Kutzneria sp. 744]|nr:allantoinase [Kutzneria sp. 744]